MITFAVENWFAVKDEMAVLWPAHWEEVAINRDKIKLNVDYDSYAEFANVGSLHVLVAREAGVIVGYHIRIIRPHLHYRDSLTAFTDVYYINPSHRKGMTGVRLFKEVEKTLKYRGVQKIFTGTKLHLDMSRIFEHLGYCETERLFTKYIGD